MIFQFEIELMSSITNKLFWADAYIDLTKIVAIHRNHSEIADDCTSIMLSSGMELVVNMPINEVRKLWEAAL